MKDNRITTKERRVFFFLFSSYTQRPLGQSTIAAFYTSVQIYTAVNFEESWSEVLVSMLRHHGRYNFTLEITQAYKQTIAAIKFGVK